MSASREAGSGAAGGTSSPGSSHWMLPGELATLDGSTTARRTGRDWAVDVVLFLFAAADWLITWVFYNSGGVQDLANWRLPEWLASLDLWLGGAACLALWSRRRFPLGFAVAMLPIAAASSAGTIPLFIALVTLAAHRPWPQAAALGTLSFAAAIPWILLVMPTRTDRLFVLVFAFLAIATCTAWGMAIRARRQLVVRLHADAERERREHERQLADSRSQERNRIAREMHDVLAHRMSLLSVHAGALAYRTQRAEEGVAVPLEPAELTAAASVIRDNAHQALDELGEVLAVLRSGDTAEAADPAEATGTAAPQHTLADIAGLVSEAQRAGQRVSYEVRAEAAANGTPRPAVQRTAYRMVQEGLTNARKHAPDAQVTVRLAGAPGADLEVTVVNPLPVGVAPTEIPGAGAGLTGLAERVALDGGTLEHGPGDGAFRLTARLPWPA